MMGGGQKRPADSDTSQIGRIRYCQQAPEPPPCGPVCARVASFPPVAAGGASPASGPTGPDAVSEGEDGRHPAAIGDRHNTLCSVERSTSDIPPAVCPNHDDRREIVAGVEVDYLPDHAVTICDPNVRAHTALEFPIKGVTEALGIALKLIEKGIDRSKP